MEQPARGDAPRPKACGGGGTGTAGLQSTEWTPTMQRNIQHHRTPQSQSENRSRLFFFLLSFFLSFSIWGERVLALLWVFWMGELKP